jgi:hypothetical protein
VYKQDLSEAKTRSEGKVVDLTEALTATTRERDELKTDLEVEKLHCNEAAHQKEAVHLELSRLKAQVRPFATYPHDVWIALMYTKR